MFNVNTLRIIKLRDYDARAMAEYYQQNPTASTIDSAGLIHDRDEIALMDLKPIETVCGPLTSAGVTMIAGSAGVGKSLFSLHMAAHIAAGVGLEDWKVPNPARCYIQMAKWPRSTCRAD